MDLLKIGFWIIEAIDDITVAKALTLVGLLGLQALHAFRFLAGFDRGIAKFDSALPAQRLAVSADDLNDIVLVPGARGNLERTQERHEVRIDLVHGAMAVRFALADRSAKPAIGEMHLDCVILEMHLVPGQAGSFRATQARHCVKAQICENRGSQMLFDLGI